MKELSATFGNIKQLVLNKRFRKASLVVTAKLRFESGSHSVL